MAKNRNEANLTGQTKKENEANSWDRGSNRHTNLTNITENNKFQTKISEFRTKIQVR